MNFFRIFQNNDGAITVFLCIITAVVLVIAQLTVDAARARGAYTQIQSAMDMAADSTLTNFDEVLKDMYGLLALSEDDPDKLKEELSYYLERTLNIKKYQEDMDKGQKLLEKIEHKVQNSKEEKYYNLYDFQLDDLEVAPLYNLSEPEVMRAQILEYMKIRAPKELIEGVLEKISSLKNLKSQTDLIQQKAIVETKMDGIRKVQSDASNNLVVSNSFGQSNDYEKTFHDSVGIILEKLSLQAENIKLEVQKKELQKKLAQVEAELSSYKSQVLGMQAQIRGYNMANSAISKGPVVDYSAKIIALEDAMSTINTVKIPPLEVEKKRCETEIISLDLKITGNKLNISKDNEALLKMRMILTDEVGSVLSAVIEGKKNLEDVFMKSDDLQPTMKDIQEILKGDSSSFAGSFKLDMDSKNNTLEIEKLKVYVQKLEENQGVLESISHILQGLCFDRVDIYNFNSVGTTTPMVPSSQEIIEKIGIQTVAADAKKYNGYLNKETEIQYNIRSYGSEAPQEEVVNPVKVVGDFIKNKLAQLKVIETTSGNIEEEYFKGLPSNKPKMTELKALLAKDAELNLKHAKASNEKGEAISAQSTSKGLDIKDGDFSMDLSFMTKALSFVSEITKNLNQGLVSMRDELYMDEYAMGSFTNYTTKAIENKDLRNLQGRFFRDVLKQKKDGNKNKENLFQDGEVEYILWGHRAEKDNISAVQTQLILTRFALNSAAIYMDQNKVREALSVAFMVSAWLGGIGAPLVQFLILLAWSFAESILDTNLIMKGSKDVPLFKLPGTWILEFKSGVGNLGNQLKEALNVFAKEGIKKASFEVIDYTKDLSLKQADTILKHVEEYCDEMVDQSINKAFSPVEQSLGNVKKFVDTSLEELNNNFNDILDKDNNKTSVYLSNIQAITSEKLKDYFKTDTYKALTIPIQVPLGSKFVDYSLLAAQKELLQLNQRFSLEISKASAAMKETLKASFEIEKSKIYQKADGVIEGLKNEVSLEIKEQVRKEKEKIRQEVDTRIQKLAGQGKEKLGEYLGGISGKSSEGKNEKSNLRTGFLTAEYKDYLRIFLLLMDKNVKSSRIGDLIQMNINNRAGKKDFEISGSNTFLRVQGTLSMKYLFMASSWIPGNFRVKNKRYPFKIALYKGY